MKKETKILTNHIVTEIEINNLLNLYKETWWGKDRTKDEIRKMFLNSDFTFSIVNIKTHQLIGFARLLTDYVYKAFLFDVIIHKGYRNQKLAKNLLTYILSYPKLRNVKHFELYCEIKMESFYHNLGFKKEGENFVFMRLEK